MSVQFLFALRLSFLSKICLRNLFTFSFPSVILFSGGFFMVIFGLLLFVRWFVFPVLVLVFLVLGIRHFLRKK